MKKIIVATLLVVALFVGVLFTGAGGDSLLRPLVNTYLKYKIPDHRIELSHLRLKPSGVELAGTVDGAVGFEAAGPVKWTVPAVDLKYKIAADSIALEGKNYPLHLAIQGTARGPVKRLKVVGKGKAFDADLAYRFDLNDSVIEGVEARLDGAQVDQILALAGMAPYAAGRMHLRVHMPRLDTQNPRGEAQVSVENGRLESALLRKDFGIELPPVKRYALHGDFRLEKRLVKGTARLESPLVNLRLDPFLCDTSFSVFKSAYRLEIPELSRLKRVTKVALYGPWKMKGEFYADRRKGNVQLLGESPSLEGKTEIFYEDRHLNADLNGVGLPQLLALLGEPPLVRSGKMDARVDLALKKELEGDYRVEAKGVWDRAELSKLTGSDPGAALRFSLKSRGKITKGIADLSATYTNDLLSCEVRKLRYSLGDGAMEGNYRLVLPELSRIKSLKEQGMKGKIAVDGTVRYLPVKKMLKVEGVSRSLGGESRFVYGGNRLTVTLKGLQSAKVLRTLGQAPVLGGTIDGSLKLRDVSKKVGELSLSAKGVLDRQAVRKAYGIDPGPKVSVRFGSKGTIRGDRLDLQGNVNSTLGKMKLDACRIDTAKGKCEGSYHLEIPKLERLRYLTGRTYHGPLKLAGTLRKDRQFHLSGEARQWGGILRYALQGDLLRVKTEGMRMSELMKLMGYRPMMTGTAKSDLKYNLAKESGTLTMELTKAQMAQSTITVVASQLLKYDLSKEIFSLAKMGAQIRGPQVLFNFNARSRRLLLSVDRGKINRDKGTIDALMKIDDRGKKYAFKLKGALDRPRVVPVMTRDLVEKVGKAALRGKVGRKVKKVLPKVQKALSPEKKSSPGSNPVSDLIKRLF